VLLETYTNIGVLINSEKTLTSSSERSLLKNLSAWLGLITLARNKPILQRHLGPKDVLISAFDTGRLIVAIPLCARC